MGGVKTEIPTAATVLMLRDTETGPQIFMVRRHGRAAWAGAHVFPGGRVDAADRDAADDRWCDGVAHAIAQLADLPPIDAVAHHVAAVRELFEEAGILLARDTSQQLVSLRDEATHERFAEYRRSVHVARTSLRDVVERERLRLALDALVIYAHWVTPVTEARRFDTRFFIARAPLHQTPAHDEAETTESVWISPSEALGRDRRDEIVLPLPTWVTLRELEPFATVDDILGRARGREIRLRQPQPIAGEGSNVLMVAGDASSPSRRFMLVNGRWRPERPDA
jgi:8-oxo-dGTP pyrophosphatase MutT (NUDIX family)